MADVDFDFEDSGIGEDKTSVQDVGTLAAKMAEIEAEINSLEDVLKQRKEDFRKLSEEDMPQTMDAANCLEFRYKDGRKIVVSDVVRASITKANEVEAFDWLETNGYGDLIKRELKLAFGKGEGEIADDVKKDVADLFGLTMADKKAVHAQTLGAFCREQFEAGKELPEKLLGIFKSRVAKFIK
jgi:hypothetical protein